MDSQNSALLSPADIDFIKGFEDRLQDEIDDGRDYGGCLTAISQHVGRFLEDKPDSQALADADPPSWSSLEWSRDGLTVRITGPTPGDQFAVTAKSTEEASEVEEYMAALNAACVRLKEIQDRSLEILRKRRQLEEEEKALRQPAETTVNDHIRLLRQYNKTKDVGQQLIGLIAENRGVPLGTLYRDEVFGVGPDD